MKAEEFFSRLWENYVQIAPTAAVIRRLVEERFGPVTNDHVAFRTFNQGEIDLRHLERAFLDWGYKRDRAYEFPDKHLMAYGYVPPHDDLPLVFMSELLVEHLSTSAGQLTGALASKVSDNVTPAELLLSGRLWQMPTSDEYALLEKESAYAAWLSVWGLCANHFTIAVHHLEGETSLHDVVRMLKDQGFSMNEVGGLFKGTPAELLEQASTLAETRKVAFSDGIERSIPSCYYEFAQRHRGLDGQFYQGFVAQSANDIFESTTEQRGTSTEQELRVAK